VVLMGTVRLKHGTFTSGKRIEHFYEGLLVVVDGIIEIPLDKEHWIRRCWVSGYNRTPDGRILWNYTDVLAEIEAQSKEAPKPKKSKAEKQRVEEDTTAESGERDADEGADSGRQPEA
jgi:hypothetical protein